MDRNKTFRVLNLTLSLLLVFAAVLGCGVIGVSADSVSFESGDSSFGGDISSGDVITGGDGYGSMLPGAGSDSGAADGAIADGYCGAEGNELSWSLSAAGKLTISGSGRMADFSGVVAPWYEYDERIIAIEIGDGVESIGENAFSGYKGFTEIVIPDSVKSIGDRAFIDCGMTSVVIGDGVESIGVSAFNSCDSMVSLVIGRGVSYISEDAFYYCVGLESVEFRNTVGWSYAFNENAKWTNIPEEELSDPAVAVQTLTNYCRYYMRHSHACDSTVVPPTCTEGGYTEYICIHCGYVYRDNFEERVDHVYADGYCLVCGEYDTSNERKEVYWYASKDLTLTLYSDFSLTFCETVYTDDGNSSVSEGEGKWYEEDDGKIYVYTYGGEHVFTVNDENFLVPVVCQHSDIPESLYTDAPTCVENGRTYYYCDYCWQEVTVEVIDATGVHKYVADGECGRCNMCDLVCEHPSSSEIDRRDADCSREGFVLYACDVCSLESAELIPTVEHSFDEEGVCAVCFACSDPEKNISYVGAFPLGVGYDGLQLTLHKNGTVTAPVEVGEYSETLRGFWAQNGDTVYCLIDYLGMCIYSVDDMGELKLIRYASFVAFGGISVIAYLEVDEDGNVAIDTGNAELSDFAYCVIGTSEYYNGSEAHFLVNVDQFIFELIRVGPFYGAGNAKILYFSLVENVCAHETTVMSDTKEPTCISSGTNTYRCEECGIDIIYVIPATGEHNFVADTVFEPTCTQQGFTEYCCHGCGETYQSDWTEIVPHEYYEMYRNEPTCMESGRVVYTCDGCGDTYEEMFSEPIGHTYDGEEDPDCNFCGEWREVEHKHEYYEINRVEPGCHEPGRIIYNCECGDGYEEVWGDPVGHTYDNDEDAECNRCGEWRDIAHTHDYIEYLVREATCIEGGVYKYVCHECGDYYVRNTEPTYEHVYDNDEDPDCNFCGEWREVVHVHNYMVSWVQEPTCTEQGFTEYQCYECGDRYQDDWVDPIPHAYTEYVVPPTCREDGYTNFHCDRCGDAYIGDYTARIPHDFMETVYEATCTSWGWTEYICSFCGEMKSDNWIEPTGIHVYDDDMDAFCNYCDSYREVEHEHEYEMTIIEPTCNTEGYTKYVCRICRNSYSENYVEPTGEHVYDSEYDEECNVCGERRETGHEHEYVIVAVYEPTCIGRGHTEYRCNVCGDSYLGDWTYPTGEHTYTDDRDEDCNVCGEWRHVHDYAEEIILPSCIEQGYTVFICHGCGDRYEDNWTDTIPHEYMETVFEPTCMTEGYTEYVCIFCKNCYQDNYVPSFGHEFDDDNDEECNRCGEYRPVEHKHEFIVEKFIPTCVECGYNVYTCTSCGHSYQEIWSEPLGHDYDDDTDADCNRCGELREVEHKHKYYEISRVEPGCHEPGRIIYNCECGNGYEEVWGDPVGHIYDNDEDPECNRCGEWRDIAHTHDYIEYLVREATCIEGGVYKYVCHECGDYYVRNTEPTYEHVYDHDGDPDCNFCGEWREIEHKHEFMIEQIPPTCYECGYEVYNCVTCGYNYRNEVGEPLGHEYDGDEDPECNRCGEWREVEHKHSYYETNRVEPTCAEAGYTTYTCSGCGESYLDKVPPLGHSYEETVIAPTCSEIGHIMNVCSVCGDNYAIGEIPATGKHVYDDFSDAECNTCGMIREVENIVANGSCGVATFWRLNDEGTLTLYGEGSTFCYTGKGMPWYSYRKQIIKIVVEEGVLSIGASSFYEFTNVTEIVLPEGLLAIGQYAFYGCSGVKSLNIPSSVYYIGNYAFRKLGATGKININFAEPNGWYRGGEAMSAEFMSDTASVTDDFRRQNYALNWNKIYGDVKILASGNCGKTATWTLDSNGTLTVSGEGKMTEFLTKGAPWYNFNGAIVTIVIEEGITSVGKCSFYGADNVISIKLPESLEVISSYAFYYCRNIPTVTIPANVTSIKQYAFRQCKGLTSIILDIKYGWSAGSNSMTSTELSGESAVEFFTKANYSDDWERDVNAEDDSDPNRVAAGICGDGIKWELDIFGVLTIKGNGPMANYNSTSENLPWYKYRDQITKVVISEGVTSIGGYAFYNVFTKIETVEIASTVTSIGKYAFYNCTSIKELTVPASVTSIETMAFRKMGASGKLFVTFAVTDGWTCGGNAVDFSGFADAKALGSAIRSSDYSGTWSK